MLISFAKYGNIYIYITVNATQMRTVNDIFHYRTSRSVVYVKTY